MVKKLIACLSVVFFIVLFWACSSSKYTGPYDDKGGVVKLDVKWSKLEKGEPFPWEDKDGFFPHEDNPYGFDRHTKPLAGKKEDSIVHASVAHNRSLMVILEGDSVGIVHGKDGFAKLKINQDYGSSLNPDQEFYICDPASSYPYKSISKIDNSTKEPTYKFTDYLDEKVKRIALCNRKKKDTTESGIVQEMHIHTYEWRNYDFLPVYYKTGGQAKPENGLVASPQFWISFLDVYKQALIAPARSRGYFKLNGGSSVIHARMRGTYDDCLEGDIARIREEVYDSIQKSNFPNRVIFQLGLPTKRFWPLKKDSDSSSIVICGNPNEMPIKDRDYDLVPIEPDCKIRMTGRAMRLNSEDNKLHITLFDGESRLMTKADLDKPECAGMAETFQDPLNRQYVEELRDDNVKATTLMDWGNGIAFVILPWHGEDTKRIANHELGHTMGLGDVRTDLQGTGDDNPKSEQGDIMFYKTQVGYKLRQRAMEIADTVKMSGNIKPPPMGYENQWDCLQRKSPEKSCQHQNWLFK